LRGFNHGRGEGSELVERHDETGVTAGRPVASCWMLPLNSTFNPS
jgi:hypothetical protein